MPNERSWNVISAPTSNRIILGVDFPAAGRREAGFDDLVAKMGTAWSDFGFLQTTPPTVRLSERPSGEFYTEHWMQDGDWEKYEVVAVFGYCVGSVYAAEVSPAADPVAEHRAPGCWFDPQLTDIQLLANEMHKMIGMAGPVFSEEEAEQARRRATEIIEGPSVVLVEAAMEIVGLYRELATIAFQRIGLSDSRRDEGPAFRVVHDVAFRRCPGRPERGLAAFHRHHLQRLRHHGAERGHHGHQCRQGARPEIPARHRPRRPDA